MRTGILIASLVLMTACAAPSEKQIEAREYRDAERLAKFLEIRRRCLDSGGILVVEGLGGRIGKTSVPSDGDIVRCQRTLALR